jgi:hypothetical protein
MCRMINWNDWRWLLSHRLNSLEEIGQVLELGARVRRKPSRKKGLLQGR